MINEPLTGASQPPDSQHLNHFPSSPHHNLAEQSQLRIIFLHLLPWSFDRVSLKVLGSNPIENKRAGTRNIDRITIEDPIGATRDLHPLDVRHAWRTIKKPLPRFSDKGFRKNVVVGAGLELLNNKENFHPENPDENGHQSQNEQEPGLSGFPG